jgi:oligoribonuclease (3'-5' exoribonuclease)
MFPFVLILHLKCVSQRLPVNMHARAILNALACLSCAVSSALSTGAMKRFHASHYIKGLHEVVNHYRHAKDATQLKTIRLLQYWWKQDWTMLCGPHCSQLSTYWAMLAARHCSIHNIVDNCEQCGQHDILFNPVKQQVHNFYVWIWASNPINPCACSSRCTTSCKPFI